MRTLQPLYEVRERLETAAVAGTGLLAEDFRLQRAAENLRPLAAASPVFGKISAGLEKLLAASEANRAGLLLDVLALADAVAYTQGASGLAGDLTDLSAGGGTAQDISYGQLQPLLTALTTTGSGRVEIVKSAWENHPEYFRDFRVLPAVIAGLGDGYSEMADLNGDILKSAGSEAIGFLQRDFDPAGKKDMARRVEILADLLGDDASGWLLSILPEAKKDVRPAVIQALGADPAHTDLLLDLAQSERGKSREAVLQALSRQDGDRVRDFWEKELRKNQNALTCLWAADQAWASDLVAAGLREKLEPVLANRGFASAEELGACKAWSRAAMGKISPAMVDFWRWAGGKIGALDSLKNVPGQHYQLGSVLAEYLLSGLCETGHPALCAVARELWDQDQTKPYFLPHAFVSAFLTRPAAEVYEEFSPYIQTELPDGNPSKPNALHCALIRGVFRIQWTKEGYTVYGGKVRHVPQRPDARWIGRLVNAAWQTDGLKGSYFTPMGVGEPVSGFDVKMVNLADPNDPEMCAQIVPFLRRQMAQSGSWRSYGKYLLRFHSSPLGLLGDSIRKNKRRAYLYYVWDLLSEAAQALPADEMMELTKEALGCGWLRTEDHMLAAAVLEPTLALLRAGEPFPAWDVWWSMRK